MRADDHVTVCRRGSPRKTALFSLPLLCLHNIFLSCLPARYDLVMHGNLPSDCVEKLGLGSYLNRNYVDFGHVQITPYRRERQPV